MSIFVGRCKAMQKRCLTSHDYIFLFNKIYINHNLHIDIQEYMRCTVVSEDN